MKNKVDAVKVAKEALALASWFNPVAGLAYYAVSAGEAVAKSGETMEAYENVKKRGY